MSSNKRISIEKSLNSLNKTPTPSTDEVNLYKELIKNPFDEAFKKATENTNLLDLNDGTMISTDSLNTPNLLLSYSPNMLISSNEEILNEDIEPEPEIKCQKKPIKFFKKSKPPLPNIYPKINSNENVFMNNNNYLNANIISTNVQYIPIYITGLKIQNSTLQNISNVPNSSTDLPITNANNDKSVKQILKESIHSTKLKKALFPNFHFGNPKIINESKNPTRKSASQIQNDFNSSKIAILEKNRAASARSRYKKKIYLQNLAMLLLDVQKHNKILQKEIRKLKKINEKLSIENFKLKNLNTITMYDN